ncbi:MAG TPA: WYL domain-containing protein [Deltaproteobacteria bacterium]|nr:WYL domain-containing protein [Deltaproteobacteria bacterium]
MGAVCEITPGDHVKRESRAVQKLRMIRVGKVLKAFLERETVTTHLLAGLLGVGVRTIQRDLKALRDAGLPVHEEMKGTYSLKKDLVKYGDLSLFDESELALIVALKDLVSQLGAPFERAAEDILSRLCEYSACRPVYVRIEGGIDLNTKTMNRLVETIQMGRQVFFSYHKDTPHDVIAHPYRVAYFNGVWYLVARDTKDGIIKKYALDKISGVRRLKERSGGMPADLDETLSRSVNVWFEKDRTTAVVIEVDADWAHYFRRRNILPMQETVESKDDGSLLLRFLACTDEEIVMCLKPWLPHVRVLRPGNIRNLLVKDFQQWLEWRMESRGPVSAPRVE